MIASNNDELVIIKAREPAHKQALLTLADHAFGKDRLFSKAQLENYFNLPPMSFYLAYKNDRPVAFQSISKVLDEMEIIVIAVHESVRKQGIGESLFHAVKNEINAHELTAIFLEVREGNLAARRFYEKLGFGTVGRRNNYYSHPEDDAIIMRKEEKINE